ncbi:PH domain-containing protein [Microbulbifer thermotolerans]|uniref:PH domain-containing protein n=1 Tax=Microbulbifer thermotolerans TaxID=252514 RepID=A0AB35HYK3_MICTH|nr:PH domain-containing protein [Microbulbifer thermotolerans]MCX2801877.1 PH domain-containing protein [Microbulbifer thermotolerans]WKT61921.1 PH domain-containing protein [Microbulbifer thermotolerans]
MTPTQFRAPWSRQLKWITVFTTSLLLAIPILLLSKAPQAQSTLYNVAIGLPLATLLLSTLFAIRGYRIEGGNLFILRPCWKTRVTLQGMSDVKADPEAMRDSIRIFGNGGLFGYIGLFRNNRLGRYRAFATDMSKSVVLRFPERTLVVTPDNPQQFVTAITDI